MERNAESISFLNTVLQDVQTAELTQQIKLTEGMPDIGRILGAWGQVVLRGKEWQDEEAAVNGGVLVWVLYAPEDGSGERCLDSWIPFQMKWDLPEEIPEGKLRIQCQLRFVDARSASPGKLVVRCGISLQAEGYIPAEGAVSKPSDETKNVEFLENTYLLRLVKEAGEKVLLLDEDLTLPDSVPQPEKLICCRMEPRVTDIRVLADKLAFRGTGNLRIVYRSEEGGVHSWDFPAAFSQVAELEQEFGSDAAGDLVPLVTNLETELDEEGHIRLKCGLTVQYRIADRQKVSVVEDAYCPGREVSLRKDVLELPVILEQRRETVSGEQRIPGDVHRIVDISFLPDFPREKRSDQGMELRYPGNLQVLYYGNDGMLQGSSVRWEGQQKRNADAESTLMAVPLPGETQAQMGSGQLQIQAELPVDMITTTRQKIPMVTAVEVGENRTTDANRPTILLRRAGENRLWDIAKGCGSTVAEIRLVNNLQGEPAPGQMLLIPLH